jgi:hypothetical protein
MSVLDDASLVLIPSGYKSGKLYSVVPVPSYGAELVTNGDFATDSDWTKGTDVTISGGKANWNNAPNNNGVTQSNVFAIGKNYKVTFTVSNYVSGTLRVRYPIEDRVSANGTYTFYLYSIQTDLFLQGEGTSSFSIDNVSVKEVLVAAADLDFTRSTTGTRVNPDGLIEDVSWNLITYSEDFSNAYWTKSGSSVVSGQTDPNGNSGAFKLVEDTSTGNHRVFSSTQTVSSDAVVTSSIYVKSAERSWCLLQESQSGSGYYFRNGIVGSSTGSPLSYNIEALSDGWFKYSITTTAVSTATRLMFFIAESDGVKSYAGDGTSGVYIFGAQLNKGSLKTYLPTQGSLVNFPRIDYTNGCGQLLMEPQRSNLITQSEAFGNSYWTKSGATIEGDASTAGVEKVVNGDFATDSDWNKGTGATISGGKLNISSTINVNTTQSNVFAVSKMYKVTLEVSNVVGTLSCRVWNSSVVGVNITSAGNYEFYYSPNSVSGITITTLSDNTATYSIDNISVKEVQGFASPSADSPTGAFKLVEDSATSRHYVEMTGIGTSAVNYANSVYVKSSGKNKIGLRENATTGKYASFDLSTASVLDTNGISANIELISDGFYRIDFTTLTSTSTRFGIELLSDSYTTGVIHNGYTGDGTSGVYIFGADLEQGSYPTSYIPTSGTSVTRTADASTTSGLSSVIGQTEGTLYTEFELTDESAFTILEVNLANSTTNRILVYRNGTNVIFIVQVGNVIQINDTVSFAFAETNKVAVTYQTDNFKIYVNGSLLKTYTSGDIPSSLDTLALLDNNLSSKKQTINALALFKTRLTNTQLIDLTTL